MLRIVKFEEKYSSALATAFKETFDEGELPYFEDFEDSGHSFVGIDRHGFVGAFILIGATEEAIAPYEIKFLGVIPRHRKHGYSLELIKEVIRDIKAPLWLSVMESNVQAVRVYEYIGFKVARRFKAETGENGVSYVINLKCHHCKKDLTPDTVIMDETPVSLVLTPYGPRQVSKLVRVCNRCRNKCEP
jgi:ribosomal protein S18 acetylase RimI-like enzyme